MSRMITCSMDGLYKVIRDPSREAAGTLLYLFYTSSSSFSSSSFLLCPKNIWVLGASTCEKVCRNHISSVAPSLSLCQYKDSGFQYPGGEILLSQSAVIHVCVCGVFSNVSCQSNKHPNALSVLGPRSLLFYCICSLYCSSVHFV